VPIPSEPPFVGDAVGLSDAEVRERVADGRVNRVQAAPVRTLGEILRANVLTRINAIIGTLFVMILAVGRPEDAVFGLVIISNSVIGIVQELRARKTLNELALLQAPRARVRRHEGVRDLALDEVVADDIIELQTGFQVVVDGEVVESDGLEVDESLLTGESESVRKATGDGALSGSFVVAGSGAFRASKVGADSYANKLVAQARAFTLAPSELRRNIDRVLRWQLLIIPPAALLLLLRLWDGDERTHGAEPWREAIVGMVAACVAMVPSGLVLLTSVALLAGALGLARRRVLTKELSSVELLARVDTLCLDKTGTITTGEITLAEVVCLGAEPSLVDQLLGALAAADPHPNPTLAALAARFADPHWNLVDAAAFSSARKWAAAAFEPQGVFYFGAAEMVLAPDDAALAQVAEEADRGRRVLAVAQGPTTSVKPQLPTDELPPERHAVALVLFEDTIRPDAAETLAYFGAQGVTLKVISGDNPRTVGAVAARVGVPDAHAAVDGRELPDDDEALADTMANHAVFGRVTPEQKRAMVLAMQSRGHVVAMTGDGVNDVLALKVADVGIAMGSGAPASRAVAQVVLLDNDYAALPRVLAEGRRVINNIERVANLFLTKSVYAVALTLFTGISGQPFPFLPRHLTVTDWFSIGLPGLFLALAPSEALVKPGFLKRTLRFAIPAGLVCAVATTAVFEFARRDGTLTQARTAATVTLLALGLVVVVVTSRPLAPWKVALAAAMGAMSALVLAIVPLRDALAFEIPIASTWWAIGVIAPAGAAIIVAVGSRR
jgi:cation-transporting P-type ATPase E